MCTLVIAVMVETYRPYKHLPVVLGYYVKQGNCRLSKTHSRGIRVWTLADLSVTCTQCGLFCVLIYVYVF